MKKLAALLVLFIAVPAYATTIEVFPSECDRDECENQADIESRSLWHVQSHADATSGFVDEANYVITIIVNEEHNGKPLGCYRSLYRVVWNYEEDNHRGRLFYPPGPAGDHTWMTLTAPWTKVSYTIVCENAKNMQMAGTCGFGDGTGRDK